MRDAGYMSVPVKQPPHELTKSLLSFYRGTGGASIIVVVDSHDNPRHAYLLPHTHTHLPGNRNLLRFRKLVDGRAPRGVGTIR